MNQIINAWVTRVNEIGQEFCRYAGGMFVQSTVLIVILLAADWLLRKHVKATLRYWIWTLVFIKLILPPTLSLPTSIGYWCHDWVAAGRPIPLTVVAVPVQEPTANVESTTWSEPAQLPESPPVQSVGWASAHAESPAESHRVDLTWRGAAFLLWLIGVAVLVAILIQRVLFVRTLAAQNDLAGESLTGLLDQCRGQMNVRREIGLRLSSVTFSPAVCGLFRPVILLPTTLLEKLSSDNLRAVLIHELAHIKRGDLWLNSIQTLLQIAYFYNPFVWLANAMTRRVREQAVDEMVLVALGAEARSYSRTLVDIAEMAFFKPNWTLRLIGVAESKRSLEGRIKHMLTMPIPKSARIGLWGFLAIGVIAAVLLPMAQAQNRGSPESNGGAPNGEYFLLLLDDKDPTYRGNGTHDDRLYLMDSSGRIQGAVTGFNVGASAGGAHVLAVDDRRRTLWVAENIGGMLWHLDLKTGQLLGKTPGLKANAAAVDPTTGNVWLMMPDEGLITGGHVQVVSPEGQSVAQYQVPGFDIAYSRHDDSFWLAGKSVYKVSRNGKVVGQVSAEIPWIAVSVSVDEKTGNAWVVVRDHPDVAGSKPEVWIVDGNAQIKSRIDLGDLVPFCVAVDSGSGVALVGCMGTTLRFTTDGEKLPSARQVPGFSVAPGGSRDHFFVADVWGLAIVLPGKTGQLGMGSPPQEVCDLLGMNPRWVASVPFTGAKLQSSAELASLTEWKRREEKQDQRSVEKLMSLGKAVLMYANDFDDKLPDTLGGVQSFVSQADMEWLKANVEYLGKGRTTSDRPTVPVAYDKTVLREGDATLVLYLDSHVAFESPERLEELGIKRPEDAESRVATQNLNRLAQAANMYADDNNDVFPKDLAELQKRIQDPAVFAWIVSNVEYLGKGLRAEGTRTTAVPTPLAYWKTPASSRGWMMVVFSDGGVAVLDKARFERLGIKTKP